MIYIKRNWIVILSIILCMAGVICIVYFAFNPSFNDGNKIINPELASNFGSFISGIIGPLFTLVGFLLLYQTILEQRKQFNIQQFESKLFELIRYHRENVNETTYISSSSKEKEVLRGREVFIELKKQCLDLYKILKEKVHIESSDNKNTVSQIINITYLIFFLGVSARTIETTKEQLYKNSEIKKDEIDKLIEELREIKTRYNDKIVFYGGHQSKLGYYFRHIYRTIKYIDECPYLDFQQKKSYAKMYRAQLTTYEQALFFFNSMSSLGKPWREKKENKKCLIEKYELIKNIPPRFLGEINVKDFYSEMEYEF